jgi:subtilisin family serine protease
MDTYKVEMLSTRNDVRTIILTFTLFLSMLNLGMLLDIQTFPQASMSDGLSKISPTLLDKIREHKSSMVNVLVETYNGDYYSVTLDVKDLGGKVTSKYKYINALAVSIPADKVIQLSRSSNVKRIYYDEKRSLQSGFNPSPGIIRDNGNLDPMIDIPVPMETDDYREVSISPKELTSLKPNTYWNPTAMGAKPVWEEGYLGQNSYVAIIDTGIWTGHFMFQNTSFVGGIDLSWDNLTIREKYPEYAPSYPWNATYEGWDNQYNHYHGSHVAGILASTGGIIMPEDDPFVQAVELYTGEPLPVYEPGYKVLWLLGMAPKASLYIVKIFDHTGGGVPEALILDSLEHIIGLKLEQGIDIDVISMSLGGPTLYDGRDLEDQLIDYITSLGITVVAAAGNDGPAPMTVGSPGSANTAIAVGAAAHPVNTRVFWDIYYESPGIGYYLYTSEEPQIIYFSSRGPTSDGRDKPTVSATGVFVLSAYPSIGDEGLAWASGTSMATPAVSGAVALLNSYAEINSLGASPEDYREAIFNGAVWLSGYDIYDQGAGYLNVSGALQALRADGSLGSVPPQLPPEGSLENITNVPIAGFGEYSASITDLPPGHDVALVFEITEATNSVKLEINVGDLGSNPLGANSFEVYIQSAKRTISNYYIESANVDGAAWFLITDDETTWGGATYGVYYASHVLEPGYMKIIVENDWTSFDPLSCNITITVAETDPQAPDIMFSGNITQGGQVELNISVPSYAGKTVIELWWMHNWSSYPTSDLDLIVFWDEGTNLEGATLNSPERVVLRNPTSIYIIIDGYEIYATVEPFEIRVFFYILGDINEDGKVDIRDVAIVAQAYGSYPGHPRWNPDADVNLDGKVDVIDVALTAANFGVIK